MIGQVIDTPIPCRTTAECRDIKTLPRNAVCEDGYCTCPNNAKNCSSRDASMHETRVSDPLVYRKCQIDQECAFEGGFCNRVFRQCDCKENYVPLSNGRHCVLQLSSIYDNCTDKNQCRQLLENTVCQNDKCVCAPGYYYVNNECWKKAEYEQSCQVDLDCSHVENATCAQDQKCRCSAETVLNTNGTKCLAAARKLLDECVEMVQCTVTFEHSVCISSLCQCKPNYHYENDMERCFLNRALDDECANDYDCYNAEDYINNSSKSLKCEASKCTCADNFIRDHEQCVNSGSSFASVLVILSALALARSALLFS